MDIITTHVNADFDGLASMVAAHRLYPGATLVFSGSQEKSIRDYLAQADSLAFDFKRLKHVDVGGVSRLILVDTRQKGRIDRLAQCLDNPGIQVHVYDHHPDSGDDVRGDFELISDVGSTVTLFTRLFREQGLAVTRDEATLMALGIYEDTGSFQHTSTTSADLEAAAWLLDQGANLDVITQFIGQDLTSRDVGMLGELVRSATTYCIQGIDVVIATITLPEYEADFSILVRRFMVMENLDALFVLIRMGERLQFIGRSRVAEVNAGIIARGFGGGGHATAAAATVKDATLFETEERLLRLLHQHVRPRAIAAEIMSAPVITVGPETSINTVNQLLTRYNVTVMPVVAPRREGEQRDEILGLISRRHAEKAIYHQLGGDPVADWMNSDVETLDPDANLGDIQRLIIEHRQRLIPVVDQDRLVGVITRTDLLSLLINDPATVPKKLLNDHLLPSTQRHRHIAGLMTEVLDRDLIVLLRRIGEIADQALVKAFAVGGFVRDLLLKIKNLDLDVVIEGDGIAFSRLLGRELGAEVRVHEKFATATLVLPDGFKVDVATARLEYYEYPAAMPTVELSSIKLDLLRRDFTINAMAIHLNPVRFGTLEDFFGSQNDLNNQWIRVLHNLSFVEDPTRIFRAIRFEQRLGFTIIKSVEKLIRNAVRQNLFGRCQGRRFFNELRHILSGSNPIPCLRRMAEFDLFRLLWPELKPNLKVDRRFIHVLSQAQGALSWFMRLYLDEKCRAWAVYLLAIHSRSRVPDLLAFCERFDVPHRYRDLLVRQKIAADRIALDMLGRPELKPSEISRLLGELSNEGLLYLMAIARKRHINKAVSVYVTALREVRPLVNGNHLCAAGYRPGPLFATLLKESVAAQLDGLVRTRDEALAFLHEHYPLVTTDGDPDRAA